jgi:hypothetical protein
MGAVAGCWDFGGIIEQLFYEDKRAAN